MSSQATIPNPAQAAAQPQAASMPVAIPGATNPVNPAAAAATNPMAAPGAVPTTASNSVVNPTAVAQSNGINWADGSNTVTGDFKDTYGSGTGTALSGALQGLGTSTSNAVQATEANVNLETNNQYKNIQATEAAQGITPNSSTAALAQGDFYSQVNSNLQQNIAQQEEGEQTELIGALTGEGSAHGGDSSFWGTLSDIGSTASSDIGAILGGS